MDSKPLTPLDDLITPSSLQILKLMIPYMPPSEQKTLAIYEKFMEFQSTIRFFQKEQKQVHIQSDREAPLTFSSMLEKMRPYLGDNESEMIDSLANAMNMMEMFQEFQNMEGDDFDERMDEQSESSEHGPD